MPIYSPSPSLAFFIEAFFARRGQDSVEVKALPQNPKILASVPPIGEGKGSEDSEYLK
jgi:hypothetical protein